MHADAVYCHNYGWYTLAKINYNAHFYYSVYIVNQAGMVLTQARIDGKSIIKLTPKYTLTDYMPLTPIGVTYVKRR